MRPLQSLWGGFSKSATPLLNKLHIFEAYSTVACGPKSGLFLTLLLLDLCCCWICAAVQCPLHAFGGRLIAA
jgi:hypothetical protein